MGKKICETVLIAAFICALWLPLLDNLAGLDTTTASAEKRILAPRPELPEDLARFPEAFEAYYDDHFGFRNTLIFLNNYVLWKLFSDSNRLRVLVGKHPWLFFKGDQVIRYCQGLDPFTQEELERWRSVLEERRSWCRTRGVEYALFITPNKHTIYPEFLPDHIRAFRSPTRLDQLTDYLGAHSDLLVIDVRSALKEAKKEERLYYWTDTHWNERGCYHAYRSVIHQLSAVVPEVGIPVERSHFESYEEESYGMDLARMLGLHEILREVRLKIRTQFHMPLERIDGEPFPTLYTRNNEPRKPTAVVNRYDHLPEVLVFNDSFFNKFLRLFSLHFSRSLYYFQCPFDPTVISTLKPDLVLEEIVERKLMVIKPRNPPDMNR